ncbi:unnamed protein product, partial [marine sediment metagenome]
ELKPPISFDWKGVTADSPPVTYIFQIATDNDFTADSIVLELVMVLELELAMMAQLR